MYGGKCGAMLAYMRVALAHFSIFIVELSAKVVECIINVGWV
jgi:hypothetical protein